MSNAIRLVILNDFDCPEPKMVAMVRGNEWTYVCDREEFRRWRAWAPVRSPEHLIDLEAFGVRAVITLDGGRHRLRVERFAPSKAAYPDGVPRDWQRPLTYYATIREKLVPLLKAYQVSEPLP